MTLIEPVEVLPLAQLGQVHFIGIGGSGMSGVAELYRDLGVEVSGSDRNDSPTLAALGQAGITTFIGQRPGNLEGADTVVYSTAIRPDNPERVAAEQQGLRVWHRSAALAATMLGKRVVAVTGTHGKTTTSAMAATMFLAAGGDPTYVIGSPLVETGRNARLGGSDIFVVEADESDGSFIQYPAEIAVITNIDVDHLVNWGTPENYANGFYRFANLESLRQVVINSDDPGAKALASRLRAEGNVEVISYGMAEESDYRLTDIILDGAKASTQLVWGSDCARIELKIPGRHNLLNAAAAFIVGRLLGLDSAGLLAGAQEFQGTLRRFQLIDEVAGVRIYDDYGHLPNELRAVLNTGRLVVGEGRLVACFQPYLYTRTTDFADEFGAALTLADLIVLTDIMGGREDPVPGQTGEIVADAAIAHGGQVVYVPEKTDLPSRLAEIARPGDLIITMGIGDVSVVGPALAKILKQK